MDRPRSLGEDWAARLAYLTNGQHLAWYASVRFTLIAAVAGRGGRASVCGLLGAAALRSRVRRCAGWALGYTSVVRGVPDVLFFLFFPLAFEQSCGVGRLARRRCSAEALASRDGAGRPAPRPSGSSAPTELPGARERFSLGIVYGAFAANVINGGDERGTGRPAGGGLGPTGSTRRQVFWRFQVRQMWVYALPGLSNVWMLLLKATSLLSLLQIQDMVLWANRIGRAELHRARGTRCTVTGAGATTWRCSCSTSCSRCCPSTCSRRLQRRAAHVAWRASADGRSLMEAVWTTTSSPTCGCWPGAVQPLLRAGLDPVRLPVRGAAGPGARRTTGRGWYRDCAAATCTPFAARRCSSSSSCSTR